jgi:NADH dehydrogenase FAD-containing subunit
VAPRHWLNASTGEIEIDEYFRVKATVTGAQSSFFAFGESAAVPGTKLGYFAMQDAPLVAKNILAMIAGKEPKAKPVRLDGSILGLPMGPFKGLLLTPWFTGGDWMISMVRALCVCALRSDC